MLELVTFAELKERLDLKQSTLQDYPELESIVNSVYAAIETYLHRKIEYNSYSEIVKPIGYMVFLEALPIEEVTSLTLMDDASTPLEGYEISTHGVELFEPSTALRVAISYTGGLLTVPDWLHRAALNQILYEYQQRDHVGSEIIRTELGAVQHQQIGLLQDTKQMLYKHRHPGYAIS